MQTLMSMSTLCFGLSMRWNGMRRNHQLTHTYIGGELAPVHYFGIYVSKYFASLANARMQPKAVQLASAVYYSSYTHD
jgi:hypothetical protein